MKPNASSAATADLLCEVCGQLPEPPKARLTLANIAVMLPIELLVHAAVVETHLPYVAKVLLLTVTATVLVIWVAEPSAAKVLRRWLHAPALKHRHRLQSAPALWRARTLLRDEPGSLQTRVVPTDPDHPATDPAAVAGRSADILKIPTAWHGPLVFSRPGEPFTPAESARAYRLAELAEILAYGPAVRQT
ncbi:hypothetical protein [Paenarthrobacter sp. NPDC018779]|uniref:hypothetical protein n=1 Tax=Paenarthrobacter sp. NPDC018779 TaxID=3364375 RepID=UPI0037C61AF6